MKEREPISMTANANMWYTHAYRRAVIDMHIPDWDDKFLSEIDVNPIYPRPYRRAEAGIPALCAWTVIE
jgi:hypothetical protein